MRGPICRWRNVLTDCVSGERPLMSATGPTGTRYCRSHRTTARLGGELIRPTSLSYRGQMTQQTSEKKIDALLETRSGHEPGSGSFTPLNSSRGFWAIVGYAVLSGLVLGVAALAFLGLLK